MKNTNIPPVVNQTTFRILYFRYKQYSIPVGVILVSILMFFYVIVPQIQQWFDLQAKAQNARIRLTALNDNIAVASALSDETLTQQLQLTFTALPIDKDFAGVVNAISLAALGSGVSLGDYNFQIGDIAKPQGSDTTISFGLVLVGKITDIERFMIQLKKQFPLSDVSDIHISPTGAALTVVFFYKPVPTIRFEAATPIIPLSPKERGIVNSLSGGTTQSIPVVASPTGPVGSAQ